MKEANLFEKGGVRMAQCPQCENTIQLSKNAKMGALIACPECHWLLEVISLNPLEFDYALRDEGWDEWEEDDKDI
jgi:lysine biosynthesis protein LysW